MAISSEIVAAAEGKSRQESKRAPRLFAQALQYSAGGLAAMLASIISYPLLTRLLSQQDYGMMTLVSSAIFGMVSLSKVGLQNSAVRFDAEHPSVAQNRIFRSTLLWTTVMNAMAIAVVVSVIALSLPGTLASISITKIVMAAAPIIILETSKIMLLNFMRAAMQSAHFTVISTLDRYGNFGFAVLFLVVFGRDLLGFYLGWLLWDCLLIGYLVTNNLRDHRLSFSFDGQILRTALSFGAPLLMMEIGGTILTYGDRYIIAKYMGTTSTAVYSAAYNFTAAMQFLLVAPLSSIIFPWASDLWTKKSAQETSEFAGKVLDWFLLVSVPVCVGVSVLREPIINVFASAKYNDAARLLPPLIVAQVAYCVYQILSLGLFVRKRTVTMALQLVTATTLNIAVNFILIPRVGLFGAAWAMCAANGLLIVLGIQSSFHVLSIRPNWRLISKILFSAGLMFLLVHFLPGGNTVKALFQRSIAGAFFYSLVLASIDRSVLNLLVRNFQRTFTKQLI
jgi:O-antigen/teichoic acid export membrane protein